MDGEGAFYQWEVSELRRLLGARAPAFLKATGLAGRVAGTAAVLQICGDASVVSACRPILRQARKHRPAPEIDRKKLCSWNAMSLSTLSLAASISRDRRYLAAAVVIAKHLQDTMATHGCLYRELSHRRIPGTLEDYAWAAEALIDLWEASGEEGWLHLAQQIFYEA